MNKAFRKYLDRTIEVITCTLLLIMVIVTSWQVISRYILNNPSSLTGEFLRFGLIWFSLLAGAYVVGKKGHIAITFLSNRIKSEQIKRMLEIFVQISFALFAVIMIMGGFKAVSLTMVQISPSLHLPMGYVYLSLPVAGISIFLYCLINLIDLIGSKPVHIQENS
ncbi:TRAP-type C4-dicarboxylate transport system, small permease component [Gracilibacillus orientalis]|uniref:TRAP-type C4-dicarboxylate transport system, small permease component n=1 Tax=Gracilibacillus orientalis TaxID=334253 RepID=A0A1I4HZ46_9BACI|nr:TRAP transporter small permease [Gracilibacillus orientalis]SFL47170.1 TRAP-type C4-dicarboxylate transport system, small permease component [Gracilibacillus orientalis]